MNNKQKSIIIIFMEWLLALYFIQDLDHRQHLNLAVIKCDDLFNWLNQKTSLISVKEKFQQQRLLIKGGEMSICKHCSIAEQYSELSELCSSKPLMERMRHGNKRVKWWEGVIRSTFLHKCITASLRGKNWSNAEPRPGAWLQTLSKHFQPF